MFHLYFIRFHVAFYQNDLFLLQFDPYSLAYVKFTPSASNPHPEFADEVYFPPQSEEELDKDLVLPPGTVEGKQTL